METTKPSSSTSNLIWLVLIGALLAIPVGLWFVNDPNKKLTKGWVNPKFEKRSEYKARMAERARPKDEMLVIGVVENGKAKAWSLESLLRPENHVYNDQLFGSNGLSITFCDIADCVKVFSREDGKPTRLGQGGPHSSRPGKMLVVADGKQYWQDTGEPLYSGAPAFPLKEVPHERTTWGEWKAKHPDSALYHEPNGPPSGK
jgi:hypothetical protein